LSNDRGREVLERRNVTCEIGPYLLEGVGERLEGMIGGGGGTEGVLLPGILYHTLFKEKENFVKRMGSSLAKKKGG